MSWMERKERHKENTSTIILEKQEERQQECLGWPGKNVGMNVLFGGTHYWWKLPCRWESEWESEWYWRLSEPGGQYTRGFSSGDKIVCTVCDRLLWTHTRWHSLIRLTVRSWLKNCRWVASCLWLTSCWRLRRCWWQLTKFLVTHILLVTHKLSNKLLVTQNSQVLYDSQVLGDLKVVGDSDHCWYRSWWQITICWWPTSCCRLSSS